MIKDSSEEVTIKKSQYLRMKAEIEELRQANASYLDINAILAKENEKLINIYEEFNQLQSKLKYLSVKSLSLAHFRIKEQAGQNTVTLSKEAYQQLRLMERGLQEKIVQLQSSIKTKKGQIEKLVAFKSENEVIKPQIARLKKLLEETDEKYKKARKEISTYFTQNQQLRQKYNKSMEDINNLMISNQP